LPLITIANSPDRAAALAGLERWKAKYPDAASHGMAATPHVMALRDLAETVEVRAVYSRTRAHRETFVAEHGFSAVADPADLAADRDIHAILLITPPNARLELVQLFARAGKHILMEKPIERTTLAARRIVVECDASAITLGIVFQHRFREDVLAARRLIASGTLGRPGTVRVAIPWWRDQAYYDVPGRGSFERDGGGVLISQAIHTLDLMLALAGPVVEVQCMAGTSLLHQMETEDFVGAGLRFLSGALGSLTATTAAFPGGLESICLDYEHASLELQAGSLVVSWRDDRIERHGLKSRTGAGGDPMAFSHQWHRALIEDFIGAIRNARAPEVTGHAALAVHKLIDALLISAASKRATSVVA
jgi:predicted dehydrogenase